MICLPQADNNLKTVYYSPVGTNNGPVDSHLVPLQLLRRCNARQSFNVASLTIKRPGQDSQ
jgi:hypothetical protein